MPFTISHAAAVLPFARLLARWRIVSAVVIGAMVPDFGLFFPWRLPRFETHSAAALLSFCMPVGLTAYWVFQYLIKTPLIELLPDGAYARWRAFSAPAKLFSMRQWLLAAGGVFAGAVTHLVWDAFTHENARGIRMIPWLEEPVVDIGNHRVAGVRLLQDGSSLIGLIVVLGLIGYGLRRGRLPPVPQRLLRARERRLWILIYFGLAASLAAALLQWARLGETQGHSIKVLTSIAVAALRGLALALLGTSAALTSRLHALGATSAHRSP